MIAPYQNNEAFLHPTVRGNKKCLTTAALDTEATSRTWIS